MRFSIAFILATIFFIARIKVSPILKRRKDRLLEYSTDSDNDSSRLSIILEQNNICLDLAVIYKKEVKILRVDEKNKFTDFMNLISIVMGNT